ncbi:hypothetical protein [Gellertiella hungarica]|uniref:ElaB/YqjD/DUF883 family membrane-anchored ribosome-binding protein n=1 Tax=Gellertiella hungarica TaxID=1572859 RepID=A0A7W6J2H9_9HYPH|nr:hypothetical protein [Gellertiella hungarica]MBB4062897.1 ElaB/YqjD/DUF883 family membrane-anchored ribosome-binding protein [Gellertiella hungarica]
MANSTSDDIAALREDLNSLRADLASLVSNLKSDATRGMSRGANQFDENMQALYRSALNSGEEHARQIGRKIEDHPLLAIMLVLGAGYLGGRMLSRS